MPAKGNQANGGEEGRVELEGNQGPVHLVHTVLLHVRQDLEEVDQRRGQGNHRDDQVPHALREQRPSVDQAERVEGRDLHLQQHVRAHKGPEVLLHAQDLQEIPQRERLRIRVRLRAVRSSDLQLLRVGGYRIHAGHIDQLCADVVVLGHVGSGVERERAVAHGLGCGHVERLDGSGQRRGPRRELPMAMSAAAVSPQERQHCHDEGRAGPQRYQHHQRPESGDDGLLQLVLLEASVVFGAHVLEVPAALRLAARGRFPSRGHGEAHAEGSDQACHLRHKGDVHTFLRSGKRGEARIRPPASQPRCMRRGEHAHLLIMRHCYEQRPRHQGAQGRARI
eukprot:scaffold7092_cov262-Pinguiococcus_pyrenoidosus.AAC.28